MSEFTGTTLVSLSVVVRVNTETARLFQRWLATEYILNLTTYPRTTRTIHAAFSGWLVRNGGAWVQREDGVNVWVPNGPPMKHPSFATVKRYLEHTYILSDIREYPLRKEVKKRGWFTQTWWRQPIEYDLNNA